MATAELKQPKASKEKIDAKQAARLALEYFNELFPNAAVSNVALEEVEFSDEDNCWLITLGLDGPVRNKSLSPATLTAVNLFGPPSPTRQFKVFKVNARTGQVISMKIRKFD
jgi:hypothetical protein